MLRSSFLKALAGLGIAGKTGLDLQDVAETEIEEGDVGEEETLVDDYEYSPAWHRYWNNGGLASRAFARELTETLNGL